jgi:hypothetical protein
MPNENETYTACVEQHWDRGEIEPGAVGTISNWNRAIAISAVVALRGLSLR